MKGLLVKDFCIIAKNKKLYAMLIFLGFFMFFMQGEDMGGFIISFVTMISGSLVMNTISTDEFDKSTVFLMTMPIQKRTYALEKYVFSFICSITCWLVSTVICCIMYRSSAVEIVKIAVVLLIILSLFQLIMIPIQLKFGGENGRMVLMGMVVAIFGLAFIIGGVGRMAFGEEAMQLWLQGMLRFLDAMSPTFVMIFAVVGWILCFLISTRVSIRAMEKREY